jgi:hypothetical protein
MLRPRCRTLRALSCSDRGGNFGWRKNRSRHLIEQRLEDVMVAPINQNDVRIAPLQCASGGNPGKPGAHDHNALSSYLGRTWRRQIGGGPRPNCFRTGRAECLAGSQSLVAFASTAALELLDSTLENRRQEEFNNRNS